MVCVLVEGGILVIPLTLRLRFSMTCRRAIDASPGDRREVSIISSSISSFRARAALDSALTLPADSFLSPVLGLGYCLVDVSNLAILGMFRGRFVSFCAKLGFRLGITITSSSVLDSD